MELCITCKNWNWVELTLHRYIVLLALGAAASPDMSQPESLTVASAESGQAGCDMELRIDSKSPKVLSCQLCNSQFWEIDPLRLCDKCNKCYTLNRKYSRIYFVLYILGVDKDLTPFSSDTQNLSGHSASATSHCRAQRWSRELRLFLLSFISCLLQGS